MFDVNKDIETIEKQVADIKLKYILELKNIKQNPDINSLRNNCFSIKFSDLSKDLVLSPSYYDFNRQKDILIAAVIQLDLKHLKNYFTYIIEKGSLPISTPIKEKGTGKVLYEGGYNFRINPLVIEEIKRIFKV